MLIAGKACLILALGVCLYGIAASLYGARSGRREFVASGRRAVYALAGTVAVAFVILQAAFLRSDFSFALVASHSSTTTPTFYRATAVWSSQEGSLLLWLLLLTLWSSLILWLTRRKLREIAPYATAVLLGFGAFFASLLVFLETPFSQLASVPAEGAGLNPLLRHPSMMIHPPMLYSGYTLFAVPFAFAVGALITRRLNADWIRSTRPFTLAAWTFLGIGIVLGARWSYSELGWGGYWAWDPVENASLMPWLTGTAFLHSVMIQERRGMLKVWNVSLVLATGVLAILGTFLVRSGILESIHAFGASTLGIPFLVLIVAMVAGSIALVAARASDLRSEHKLDSLLSRESVFLLNNLVLVALCLVIFWGTFFPLISEALTGTQRSFGPPMFDRYTVPLALMLVLLSGIGPVIAWRRATASNLRRNLLKPVLAGVGALLVIGALGAFDEPKALLMFGLAGFVLAAVSQELFRGVRARRAMSGEAVPLALVSLVRRNRRRYGGYLVHAGVAVLFVGRGGVIELPGRARGPALTRRQHPGRGLRGHLRQADREAAGGHQRPAGADRPGRAAEGHAGRQARGDDEHRQVLLPVGRADVRADLALLRGRGDQRGRPQGRLAPRHLDGDRARHRLAAPAHPGGRQGVQRREADARAARRVPRPGARRAHPLLRERPAAGDVPDARLADGHVDLGRRPDRVPRRPDRPVAAARRRHPPRPLDLRGPRRA